jgi:hypothetical protein
MKNCLITTVYYPIRANFASFNKISETKIRAIIRYESAGQVAKN